MAEDTTIDEEDIKRLAQRGGMGLGEQQVFWEAWQGLISGSGAGNAYDDTEFIFRDDWLYGATQYFSLTPATNYGDYSTDWTNNARIVPISGTGRLGVVALQTGDLTECRCRIRTGAMGAFDSTKYESISFEAVVAFEALATGGEDYWAEIGLVGNKGSPGTTDSLGDVAGYMHAFRYNRSVGGAKWIAVNRNNDVETAVILDGTLQGSVQTVDAGTITALSLPDSGFFRLKVIAYSDPDTGAGAYAEYYVDGVLCATITTNMVEHSLAGSVAIQKTAGTTSRYLALDYTELAYVLRDGEARHNA